MNEYNNACCGEADDTDEKHFSHYDDETQICCHDKWEGFPTYRPSWRGEQKFLPIYLTQEGTTVIHGEWGYDHVNNTFTGNYEPRYRTESEISTIKCCGTGDYDPKYEFCCDDTNSRPVPFLYNDTDKENHINNFYLRTLDTRKTDTLMGMRYDESSGTTVNDDDVYDKNFGKKPKHFYNETKWDSESNVTYEVRHEYWLSLENRWK